MNTQRRSCVGHSFTHSPSRCKVILRVVTVPLSLAPCSVNRSTSGASADNRGTGLVAALLVQSESDSPVLGAVAAPLHERHERHTAAHCQQGKLSATLPPARALAQATTVNGHHNDVHNKRMHTNIGSSLATTDSHLPVLLLSVSPRPCAERR